MFKIELVNIEMRKDENRRFLFTLTYHVTRENGEIDEYILEDVENPFDTRKLEIKHGDPYECLGGDISVYLHLDDNFLHIYNDEIIVRTIKKADPVEVTMDDIEKQFGRPVKIVKSKEEK